MKANEDLINRFYSAFQIKDYAVMQSCYSSNVHFSDPVFPRLNASEVKAMWEMFCKNGENLSIEFQVISSSDKEVKAQWKASYIFNATQNQVENIIDAHFMIEDGLIIQHTDQFNFHRWARQALGFTGFLLGWTSYLKNTVRKQGAKALHKFMKNKGD
jgi:hypothetical protein